jgi:hypothetical protein
MESKVILIAKKELKKQKECRSEGKFPWTIQAALCAPDRELTLRLSPCSLLLWSALKTLLHILSAFSVVISRRLMRLSRENVISKDHRERKNVHVVIMHS